MVCLRAQAHTEMIGQLKPGEEMTAPSSVVLAESYAAWVMLMSEQDLLSGVM